MIESAAEYEYRIVVDHRREEGDDYEEIVAIPYDRRVETWGGPVTREVAEFELANTERTIVERGWSTSDGHHATARIQRRVLPPFEDWDRTD